MKFTFVVDVEYSIQQVPNVWVARAMGLHCEGSTVLEALQMLSVEIANAKQHEKGE